MLICYIAQLYDEGLTLHTGLEANVPSNIPVALSIALSRLRASHIRLSRVVTRTKGFAYKLPVALAAYARRICMHGTA